MRLQNLSLLALLAVGLGSGSGAHDHEWPFGADVLRPHP